MRVYLGLIIVATLWGCQHIDDNQHNPVTREIAPYYWAIDWHPTVGKFATAGTQDSIRIFDTQTNTLHSSLPYAGTITQVKWHPSREKLAISVQDGLSTSSILDLSNNRMLPLDSISPEGARAAGWNSSGDLLAVGDYEGFLTVFNDSGHLLRRIQTGQKAIIGLGWHPGENLIVAVGDRISLYNYDLDSLWNIEDRTEDVLMLCVNWHPSGAYFVTGDYGDFTNHYPPLLQFWEYDGQKMKAIIHSKAEYRNIRWSGDGEVLATASDKIRLWSKAGELIAEAETPYLLWGIDWNNDDSQIVATDDNGNIIFWDRQLNMLQQIP